MSLAYCLECLKRIDDCKCSQCAGNCTDVVYGEKRVAYIKGYRDSEAGKEINL